MQRGAQETLCKTTRYIKIKENIKYWQDKILTEQTTSQHNKENNPKGYYIWSTYKKKVV
jgi:hypothetical protein